ncbi:UDP-2,4-diacetamido-2,4,6-trideoxy-beta-L-altropyranose hydrolase [Alphaproteobacteria bacterium]|nr:UDP-2,4-diacetamido-2,4,6-trideoxy-beta-L-altropyranose hydrolase [Alphaproteobacteria bacterium]
MIKEKTIAKYKFPKYIVFRVDVSPVIGVGHVMRCLTLANSIRKCKPDYKIHFLFRSITASMRKLLELKNIDYSILQDIGSNPSAIESVPLKHSSWLGSSQNDDANAVIKFITGKCVDWLVIDHYGIDYRWESLVKPLVKNVFVLDDLADRKHNCDILLDQNYYSNSEMRYVDKVSSNCCTLLGPNYALLREEFVASRRFSNPRKTVNRILIMFGGVDFDCYTFDALEAVSRTSVKNVDIVIGNDHPQIKAVTLFANKNLFKIHVQTNKIHDLMAQADLAIGAAGASSWERCAVGLPTICLSVAENQNEILTELSSKHVVFAISEKNRKKLPEKIYEAVSLLSNDSTLLYSFSINAFNLVDANGAQRVLSAMMSKV